MRIGTWNVENRLMSTKHEELFVAQKCDVWLLTELNSKWVHSDGKRVLDFHCQLSSRVTGRNQHWAAVLSILPLTPTVDPHPASAAAIVNGITYCSTILPWKGANGSPWIGSFHSERTGVAVKTLLEKLSTSDLVWGGDWNHSLIGKEHAGSIGGRKHVLDAVEKLKLKVPTTDLLHRGDYCNAIDHIGVPYLWTVKSAKRIDADGLSDHDAYVVEI